MLKMTKLPMHTRVRKLTVHVVIDEKVALPDFIWLKEAAVVSHRTYRAVKRTEEHCTCWRGFFFVSIVSAVFLTSYTLLLQ